MKNLTDREKKAVVALHDFGTRDGATSSKVMKQMKEAGFTTDEITAAAEYMKE